MAPTKRASLRSIPWLPPKVYIDERLVLTWAYLEPTAVRPGEPVPIEWGLFSTLKEGGHLGPVVARVSLESGNIELYESQPTPLHRAGYLFESGAQHATALVPAYGPAANALYRIGSTPLRIDVATKGIPTVFSESAYLEVVREFVNADWWEWTDVIRTPDPASPDPGLTPLFPFEKRYQVAINHPFTFVGRIVNRCKSPNSTLSGSVTLIETAVDTNTDTELETASFTIGPGAYQEIVFKPITKNWTWLVSKVWVYNPSEKREKTFLYRIRFRFSDSFGNFYADTDSLRVWMDVRVTKEKKDYASGALAALGLSAIASIFSFGSAASLVQAIANGLGDKALDPPEPDPAYRTPVRVRPPLPAQAVDPKNPHLRNFLDLLRFAERAVALMDALGEVHCRLLGARIAEDSDAIALQRRSYRSIERNLQATVSELVEHWPRTASSLSTHPDWSRDAIASGLIDLQRRGLSPDTRRCLVEQGCSEDMITQIMRAAQEPAMITIAGDVTHLLAVLAWSIAETARSLHLASPAILNAPEPRVRRPRGTHARR